MPCIKFAVGKKIYSIDADDEASGAKIADVASRLNKKVNEIALNLRDLDDSTCVVLAGVLILNELEDLQKKYEDLTKAQEVAINLPEEKAVIDPDFVQISRKDLEFLSKKMQIVEVALKNIAPDLLV